MKSIAVTWSLALSLMTGASLAQENPAPPILKVMLQGSSAADMRALVEAQNGTVTHDLPIIDAVGASLTRGQLNEILKSPLVGRHLDDLDFEPPAPDEASPPACEVDGALELEIQSHGLQWRLYNKQDTPAVLAQVTLDWPSQLGAITALTLDGTALPLPKALPDAPTSLSLTLGAKTKAEITDLATLEATFEQADKHSMSQLAQHDFELSLDFQGECSTELIPGYLNNDENTYYPTVIGANELHQLGITGKGVTVAIVDSGLWEHEALTKDTSGRNRLLARYNAIDDSRGSEAFDESGHGTHMASVLAHSGPVTAHGAATGSFKGVAPDVNLVAVKAFDTAGQGGFLDIVRGIQFVVEHRKQYNIKVLNLSFAARPRWHYWQDPVNQAVMQAWASGIAVVAAAGNEGPEAMSIGSPGNLPYVITVGAVTDSWTLDTRDDDYVPDFSSRGPTPDAHIKPDLVAPGGHMTGITRPGSTLTRDYPDYLLRTGEFVMTGTSQAAALVSGIAALLLQLEPDLSPDDIKCKLTSSAELAINEDGLLAYSPFTQGHGYASATRAVTLGQRGCGNEEMDIEKDLAGTDHFQGPAIVEEDGQTSLPGLRDMYKSNPPSAKGLSTTRKWGVKDHIERKGYRWNTENSSHTFNWERMYLEEKALMESLATDPGVISPENK